MPATKAPSLLMNEFLKNEIGNSKRVLDVGCGDGAMALYLASSLNCRVDGIDLDKGRVHRANEKFRKRMTKGLALCRSCDSENIDKKFKNETFDAVLIIHTLHHLADLSTIFPKIKHSMRVGGKIFVGEYERNFGEKQDNCPRFSSNKIKSILDTSGFGHIRGHNVHKNFIMITAVKGGIK